MTRRRLLLILLLGPVIVLGATAAWLWNTDLGRFQPWIEQRLEAATGLEITVAALSVELGPGLQIRAESLRVANPGWRPSPHVFSADDLALVLDLGALLGGPVVVEAARISGGRLDLAWNEAGVSNLVPPGRPAGDTDDEEGGAGPAMLVREALVTEFRITLSDPDRDTPVHVELTEVSVALRDDDMLDLSLEGAVNGQPARYEGEVGRYGALLTGDALSGSGTGAFGTLALEGRFHIDNLAAPSRPVGELSLTGPDLRDLERMLGLRPGQGGSYALTLTAETTDQNRWTGRLEGNIGAVLVDLAGEADSLRDLEQFDLRTKMSGPDLNAVLRLAGWSGAPESAFDLDGAMRRRGPELALDDVRLAIGEARFELNGELINFPHLRDSRLRLHVEGPELAHFRALFGLPGLAQGPFLLDAEIDPATERLDIVQARVETSLGELELSGSLTDDPAYVGSEATFDFHGDDAQAVLAAAGHDGGEARPFRLSGDLRVEPEQLRLQQARLTGLYGAEFQADGPVAFDPRSSGTRVRLRATGANLAATLARMTVDWPLGPAAFDLSATLQPGETFLRLDTVEGTIGRARISGEATVPLREDLDGLEVSIDSSGPSLAGVLAPTLDTEWPDVDWNVAARVRRDGARLAIDGLDLRIGGSTVTGAVDLPWPVRGGDGRFRLQGQGPSLGAVIPRIRSFRPAEVPWNIDLDGALARGAWELERARLSLERGTLEARGRLGAFPEFAETALSVQATVPDLSRFGSWAGDPLPAIPAQLNVQLTGSRSSLEARQLELTFDDSRVEGAVTADFGGTVPFLTIDVVSPLLDLRVLGPETPQETPPAPEDGRVIPDLPLPLEALAAQDADLSVSIDQFATHRRLVSDVALEARLRDGALTLQRYHAKGLRGDVTASGHLTPLEAGSAELAVEFDVANLIPMREAWLTAEPGTLPKIDASGRFLAVGDGLRSLAADLDGGFGIVASAGLLPGKGLGALNQGLMQQLIDLLIPGFQVNQPSRLNCFAARIAAEDGLLSTDPMLILSTERVLIKSSGTLNLADERLDVGFETTPAKLLGLNLAELANPFVRIRGTLADPKPEVDPTGTLVFTGAAAATGGLSILAKGLWDRITRTGKPCERLREELRQGRLDAMTPEVQ